MKSLLFFISLLGVAQCEVKITQAAYLRLPDQNGNYRMFSGAARESAWDNERQFLYVVAKDTGMLNVIHIGTPGNPERFYWHQFDPAVDGRPLDIEVCRSTVSGSGAVVPTLAISFDSPKPVSDGHVNFYRAFETVSDTLTPLHPIDHIVRVGSHPDNIKFTTECLKLVVSDEGIPGLYESQFQDPDGSVSVIEYNANGYPTISKIHFHKFDDEVGDLVSKGIRYILRRHPPDTGPIILLSQNIEPEYIAISPSGGFAYITLQENNAIARVDLENLNIVNLYPMGSKAWADSFFDPSDVDKDDSLRAFNVRGLFQPDKIAFFEFNNVPYIVTTDQGKPTQIPEISFSDNDRGRLVTYDVDASLNAQLQDDNQLGRLYVSKVDGFTETPNTVYTFGGRGFSVWDSRSMTRVYESGDQIEKLTKENGYTSVFNGDCSQGTLTPVGQKDDRSDDQGPALSALAYGVFNSKPVMFFGSGFNGVIYVYGFLNIATPVPVINDVKRSGGTDVTWDTLYSQDQSGDAIITDIKFATKPEPMLLVTSKGSGSISVYTMSDDPVLR